MFGVFGIVDVVVFVCMREKRVKVNKKRKNREERDRVCVWKKITRPKLMTVLLCPVGKCCVY